MTTSTLMTVGRFSYSPSAPRWSWSDEMFTLHGMEPGDVVPTRLLFLSHVHPEDRPTVEQLLDSSPGTGVAGGEYRLVDLNGCTRNVIIALTQTSEAGTVWGFLADDTARLRRAVADGVNAELQHALESHAVIDQAKGALMLVYGVDDQAAFQMLRAASQQHNIRLRTLAQRFVDALQAAGGLGQQTRAAMDDLFMALVTDAPLPSTPRARRDPLQLSFDHRAPIPTLNVSGRVDLASMEEFGVTLSSLIAAGRGHDAVMVRLRDVDRIGSVARSVLEAARRRSKSLGVTMGFRLDPEAEPSSIERPATKDLTGAARTRP